MKSITIIGLGWLGEACANYFVAKGYEVKGTKRLPSYLSAIKTYKWELGDDFPIEAQADYILISIACREIEIFKFEKLFTELKHLKVKKVIFISTTSVYNACKGELTEQLDLKENLHTNKHLEVSNLCLETLTNAAVLRLSGLVGPNRNPAKFLSGRKDLPNANQKVNLVHQQDVLNIIELCIDKNLEGVYNVCSSAHPTRKEFYSKVCEKFNLAIPEFSNLENEQTRWVANSKLVEQTNYEYVYDDLLKYYLSSEAKA
jgi:nucleoside-diphosphate-sugar epimerase